MRAQIKRGDTLTVGIWGGAQERITREHCARPLEEKYGVKINFVLGGTPDRRARAYAERGRPSFDIVYLNIFESRQAVKDGVTQAPTAGSVILAGVRTALVINVGMAALAFLIGGGGLGETINSGLKLQRDLTTFTGAAMVALVALTVDWIAAVAERVLRPRGL